MLSILNRIVWLLAIIAVIIPTLIDDDLFILGLIVAGFVRFLIIPKSKIEEGIYELQNNKQPEKKEKLINNFVSVASDSVSSYFTSEDKQKEEKIVVIDEENEKKENVFQKFKDEKKEIQKPKEPNFIQKFFAENALAKIGGILLFLGVLFLLQLIYTAIGPVGKLIIGFAIGFAVYGVGIFLDKKKLVNESRILLGTGILINYLVILSGRYLIGDSFAENMIFSEGITFLLLIFNTVFAVLTSLIYKSHSLLFFSFIFAYINPFLIGADASDTPYTLAGYGMIISLGAMVLSGIIKKDSEKYSANLLTTAFLGGNFLFLVAPFESTTGWIIKLTMMAILSLLTFFTAYRNNQNYNLGKYFLGAYLFLALLIGYGSAELGDIFETGFILSGYLFYFATMLIAGIIVFSVTSLASVVYLMVAPLVLLIALLFTEILPLGMLVYILMGTVVFYLFTFVYLVGKLSLRMQYAFFAILGIFICLITVFFGETNVVSVDSAYISTFTEKLGSMITTFLFLLSAYFFSTKKNLEYLYAMGTVFSILMLLPIISRSGDFVFMSIVSIVGVTLLNILLPFINKSLLESKVRNLIIGLIAGVLFGAGEIFYFGEMYFSGLTLGIAFLGQAVLYFILGFLMLQKMNLSFAEKEQKIQDEHKESAKNVVYTLLGISISLFSLAIAFVFSKHSEVVSAVWLFEASLMFLFYKRTLDFKVYFAGVILMIIGLFKLFILLGVVQTKEFLTLIPLTIIFLSLVVNLKFLEKTPARILHDLGHMIGVALIGLLLLEIIPSTGQGWSILGIASFSTILAFVYTFFNSGKIKYVFVGFLILFFIFQIGEQESIYWRLQDYGKEYLKVLQYISTAILGLSVYIYNKFLKIKLGEKNLSLLILNTAFALYLFIISTIYVYDIFANNEFVVTIYWGAIAFALLNYGIQKEQIKYRTIGLYILILTVGKILIFDIWSELDNAIVRVIALMLVGGLMIIVSTLYSKKYAGNLKGELSFKNLKE